MEKIFIGVSWPYANGPLHLGHLAGQHIVVDVFARYHRIKGNKVLQVSGSDMHGTPITTKAEKNGQTPEEFANYNHQQILKIFKALNLYYDNYTKTHQPLHFSVAQNITKVLYNNGFLKSKKTKQFYDTKKHQFLVDRYIEGTCPYCGAKNARGDQCEVCGHMLSPTELIDPISILSGSTPVLKETTNLYFDIPKLQNALEEWIRDKNFWRKNTIEFTKAWLKEGLNERAITRDINWGIPVPIKGFENKVLYVWFEAVIGYLSASIEWAQKQGAPNAWEDFWKDNQVKHFYFIAKDNIPFHTLFWPAQIMAYNTKYKSSKLVDPLPGETTNKPLNLPYNVVANMFLNIKGQKMSKSRGIFYTAQDFLDRFDPDLIRFFFTKNSPENHDMDFELNDVVKFNNEELLANIGNLIYRVLSFAKKNYGKVPEGKISSQLIDRIKAYVEDIGSLIEDTHFSKSVTTLLKLSKLGNQIFNKYEPWKNPNSQRSKDAVFTTIQIINNLKLVLRPYTPKLASTINEMLESDLNTHWQSEFLKPGHEIGGLKIPVKKV